MKLFSELKDRRLVQIVFSYLAAGWIALEVVDQLTQHAVVPELLYRLLLVWYLLGILAAFLVGWNHGEKGKQQAPLSEILVLAGLGLFLVGFSGVHVADHVSRQAAIASAEASALDLSRIAVLYFDDLSHDGTLGHIADGLTESLISELSTVRGLDVVSRNGVATFREGVAPPDSIARELRAGTLVEGSIQPVGDHRVRVNIALLEGESGAPFGRRASFERSAEEIFGMREALAEEVSRMMRDWLREEVEIRRAGEETESQAAWVLYQRAEKARKDGERAAADHDAEGMAAAFVRADSILEQAEMLDPDWPAPMILRGWIDYRRARLSHDRHSRVEHLLAGEADAERALAINPVNAEALGLRGTLRYFRFLQRLIHDPDEALALRTAAKQDLERAVDLDPTQADVWSALQHVYYSESTVDAVRAGERAYEEDAYLEAASDILWRLYSGHYDLGNFTNARRWCEEGARRFPDNDRFAQCRLMLMHTDAVQPEPDAAWDLAAEIDSLAQSNRREFARVQARIYVAAALGNAGLADSARAVLERAHAAASPQIDPHRELLHFEGAVWSMLGDDDRAIDVLKEHKAADPDASFRHHWWWRTVRSHPRYSEIAPDSH